MRASIPPSYMLFFTVLILKFAFVSYAQENIAASQTYEASGTLKDFNATKHAATIAHEAIPGFMSAMTMEFDVPDVTEFRSFRTGDRLAFRLCVQGDRAWIDHVHRTDTSLVLAVTLPKQDAAGEFKAGEMVPDMEWTNQSGKKIRLSDLRSNALAITFIYLRCPLPTYCPLMNRNFSTTRTLLKQMGAQENWRMIFLSLDAEHDTPAMLAAYAKIHQADGKHWSFATAAEPALRRLGDAVGLEFQRNGLQINHNLRTVVIDVHGRIAHIFRGNSWTPQELAAELRRAMQPER